MWMNHPSTARRGVFAGIIAMVAAIGGTLLLPEFQGYGWIAGAMVLGLHRRAFPWRWSRLTAVPQRTALSHAFGGLAAGLVGAAEFYLWIKFGGPNEKYTGHATPFNTAPWWPKSSWAS